MATCASLAHSWVQPDHEPAPPEAAPWENQWKGAWAAGTHFLRIRGMINVKKTKALCTVKQITEAILVGVGWCYFVLF